MAPPTPTRRHSRTPDRQLQKHLEGLYLSVAPSVVAIESHFLGSKNWDLQKPVRQKTGVFVSPTTIVTSADVVGRVIAEKPADKCCAAADAAAALHRSYIAHNFAFTRDTHQPLRTNVLAVCFSHDVAVLEVVDVPPEGTWFTPCSIAKSPPEKGGVVMGVVHLENMQFGMMPGHVRAVGEKTVKSKAPWPLDDGSGWVEFDSRQFNGGYPRSWSDLFISKEAITGIRPPLTGSPLFNGDGEFFGVASWGVTEKGTQHSVTYGASLLQIMAALEYAKNKKPDDPIVMDTWIHG